MIPDSRRKAVTPQSRNSTPPIMTVYCGQDAEGEIQDFGPRDVRAFVGVGDERKPIGTYPDRRTAMRAVSAAVQARKRLVEPAPFKSGLPE